MSLPPPIHWCEHDNIHIVPRIVVISNVDVGNIVVVVIVVVVVVIIVWVDIVDNIGRQGDGTDGKVEKCEGAVNIDMANSTVQYSTVLYSTVLYSTVQYSKVQYSTVKYRIIKTSKRTPFWWQGRESNPGPVGVSLTLCYQKQV